MKTIFFYEFYKFVCTIRICLSKLKSTEEKQGAEDQNNQNYTAFKEK